VTRLEILERRLIGWKAEAAKGGPWGQHAGEIIAALERQIEEMRDSKSVPVAKLAEQLSEPMRRELIRLCQHKSVDQRSVAALDRRGLVERRLEVIDGVVYAPSALGREVNSYILETRP